MNTKLRWLGLIGIIIVLIEISYVVMTDFANINPFYFMGLNFLLAIIGMYALIESAEDGRRSG